MEISLTSGIRASLLTIQETDTLARTTQQRLATGHKVNTSLDNPTNFFLSASLRSAASDLQQLQDGVTEGINVIKAAQAGLTGISSLLLSMQGMVEDAAASADPGRKSALAKAFDETYAQINSIARDSGYGGTNLISNSSSDPLTVTANDLRIPLSRNGTANYLVAGRFLGAGYVLHEAPGAHPAWVADDRGTFLTGYGATSAGSVGNLSDVTLVIRFQPQRDTAGDADGDGVLEAGEGTEIDLQLTNNNSVTAKGIGFSNATTSTGWRFVANTAASLGTVGAGHSVITDISTDLDLNLPPGSNGESFSITLDVTSDGVRRTLTFGPLTVGAITNGQRLSAEPPAVTVNPTVDTEALQVGSGDYQKGVFHVTFPDGRTKTLYAERQGLQIYHSWAYNGFESEGGLDAARTDIANALVTVRSYAAEIGTNSVVMTVRGEFNEALTNVYLTGADNLTLADMDEESASALMLQTRRQLETSALAITGEAAQAVLKMLE